MNSVEQCNVQHAIGGLEAAEGYLSTTVDLTKQVKPSFALPPLCDAYVMLGLAPPNPKMATAT